MTGLLVYLEEDLLIMGNNFPTKIKDKEDIIEQIIILIKISIKKPSGNITIKLSVSGFNCHRSLVNNISWNNVNEKLKFIRTKTSKTMIKAKEIKPEWNKDLHNSLYLLLYNKNNKQAEISINKE